MTPRLVAGRLAPRAALCVGLAFSLAACAAGTPRPGQAGYAYNVSGAYQGRLIVDNQPFDAALRLRTLTGGRVSGLLRVVAPVEIEGSVRGRIIDDLLRITVTYRSSGGCDGSVEGVLDIEPGGETITGPVTITDCREPVAGRLSVRR